MSTGALSKKLQSKCAKCSRFVAGQWVTNPYLFVNASKLFLAELGLSMMPCYLAWFLLLFQLRYRL